MELQIRDILSTIRSEGIEKAEAEANAIVANAKQQASAIIADAKAQAAALTERAGKEAELFRANARLDAEQAKRDAVLAFKGQIQEEFTHLLSVEVGKTMQEKTLAALIAAALQGEDSAAYVAEVREVNEVLRQELAQQLRGGLEIRPSKSVQAGFRLAAKDGSGFFDCTDEEVVKMLLPFFRNAQM